MEKKVKIMDYELERGGTSKYVGWLAGWLVG